MDWQTVPGREMTFTDLDVLQREREAKKRELVDRLTALLVQNFEYVELRFAWFCEATRSASKHTSGLAPSWQGGERQMPKSPVKQPDNLPATPKPQIVRPTPKTVPIKWPHPKPKGK